MNGTSWKKGTVVSAIAVFILLVIGLLVGASSDSKSKDTLGAFNPAIHKTAQTAPLGEVGPGACLPARTFNNSNGTAEVVKYLSGHDPRDTTHGAKSVAARDVKWLTTYQSYYHYTANQSDASWHEGLVLEQLSSPITVTNTYCPSGQDTVAIWKVQTLPVGEWVWFLKGHGQNDGTNIIPVRKAVCGNFLLPPPPPPPVTTCKVRCNPTPTPSPTCMVRCHPTPRCVPPSHIPTGYAFNPTTCELYKPPQTKPCMLNGGPNCPPNGGNQPPQSNPCCYTGPTVGAPTNAPSPAPTGPKPSPGTSAPPPNSGGYDSGSGSGSGTPQGSTCDSSGCTGGGPSNPSPGPTDGSNSGDNNSGASPQPSPPG